MLGLWSWCPPQGSGFRKVSVELIKGPGPSHPHSIVVFVERPSLRIGRVEWSPFHSDFRPAAIFGEGRGGEHFERPAGTERMPCESAVFVGERIDQHDSFGRCDLAVHAF